jgi:hypothetical protein
LGRVRILVDAATGLLTTYSPAPGVYVRYDYSAAKQFPGSFTITETGRTIVGGPHRERHRSPLRAEPLFTTTGLTPQGVGRAMNPAMRMRSLTPLGNGRPLALSGTPVVQAVVLHGNMSPDGHVSETEILVSGDSSLNQAALDRASQWGNRPVVRGQPGAPRNRNRCCLRWSFDKRAIADKICYNVANEKRFHSGSSHPNFRTSAGGGRRIHHRH